MPARSPGSAITRSITPAAEAARGLAARLRTAPAPLLLAALVLVQLAITVAVALHERHNGFVWYSGGDATEYWTSAWSLAHGAIPETVVGYGVPVLWSWLPLFTGHTLVSGLPVVVILQALVLVPLVLVLVWAVADLLFGRLYAWWAAVLWILAPLLMLWGFRSDYAGQFATLFLAPHWYGLTMMADLPSTAAVLATMWATLRLLQRPSLEDAVLAGVLAGVAVGLKPANGYLVPAVVVLVLGMRRILPVVAYAAGAVPAVVTLTLWKVRGLGSLPLNTALGHSREASGMQPVVAINTQKYVRFDWGYFHHELLDLEQVFWSVRVLEFLVLAGVVAAIRRAPLKGAFLAVWFASYCIAKGSSTHASITQLSFWRLVEPGLPAMVLLIASIVFLVPRGMRTWPEPRRLGPLPGGRRLLGVAVGVLAIVPLALVVVESPWSSESYVRIDALANDAPISSSLAVSASTSDGSVRLAWQRPSSGHSRSYFVIYRSTRNDGCTVPPPPGAKICLIDMDPVAMTRATHWSAPAHGRAWYRIALMVNYRDVEDGSDLMLIGPATTVG